MTIMLLEWVITSVFLILTVLALRALFGKRVSARLRYALWAVVLVRLLVPVQLFTTPLAGTRVFTGSSVEQNIHKVTGDGLEKGRPEDITALGVPAGPSVSISNFPQAPAVPELPDAPEPPAAPDLTKAPVWLGWIWLGGSAAMALVLAASNLRFARRLRRCRIPLEGTDCPLRVYAAVGLPSPCLFGLVRPAVYVTPEAAADPVMLRHVVAHEYTHFRHADHLWSFLRCAALAVHWWNPLVWLAVTLSRRDGELACDEGALGRLGDDQRLAYGNTLLALVTARPGPGELLCFATTMAGEKRSLKERISRIACAPKRILWAALAVVLVTALACVCAFGQAAEEPEDKPDPAPAESQDVTAAPVPDSEWEADLNHNGVPETLRVSGSSEKMLLKVWEDGELIFSEEAYHSHAGWNALFLYQDGDGDYLLRYNPYMGQGWGTYSYSLFTLSGDGEEQVAEERSIEFDINFETLIHESFDPDAIIMFMDEINGLLADSVQLLNTDGDLLPTFEKEGRLYDSLGWLDWWEPVFVRDESKSLLENLWDFQAAMEGQVSSEAPTVFPVDELGTDILLSYQDKSTHFKGAWDYHFQVPEYVYPKVVDLNGDGRNEIMVVLNEGHGTGCSIESLYLFDAETLEQYDTSTLTQDIIGQIKSTGDKDNFYLSGPGMERVTISKSLFNAELPIADTISMGDIIYYSLTMDGRLWCMIGCDASGRALMYCGNLYVLLGFDGTKVRAVNCTYEADREYDPSREAYRQVLEGEKAFTLAPEQRSVTIRDVPGLFNDDPYTEIWSFAVVDMDGDGTNEVLLDVCGVSGDMGGYLLLHQEDGQVYGTVFNAKNNWSNRWFQNLKNDGTFECQGIMDSWESVSKLFFTAGGGTGIYGLTVIRNDPSFDLEGFMVVQNEIAHEDDWWAAVKAQKAKPNAVWRAFSPENIDELFG